MTGSNMFIVWWMFPLGGLVIAVLMQIYRDAGCNRYYKLGQTAGEESVTHRGRDLAVKMGVGHHYLNYYAVDAPPEVLFDYKPWVNAKRCAAIDVEYAKDSNWMPSETAEHFNTRTDACGPPSKQESDNISADHNVTSGGYQARGIDVLRYRNKAENYRVATCSGYSCEITGELVSAEKMAAWIANSLNRG